jgi:hypothetical protein
MNQLFCDICLHKGPLVFDNSATFRIKFLTRQNQRRNVSVMLAMQLAFERVQAQHAASASCSYHARAGASASVAHAV